MVADLATIREETESAAIPSSDVASRSRIKSRSECAAKSKPTRTSLRFQPSVTTVLSRRKSHLPMTALLAARGTVSAIIAE